MTRGDIDEAVMELASRQHGAFSLPQLMDLGGDDRLARRRVVAKIWRRPVEQVLTIVGHPPSFGQQLWVASLDVDRSAAVTHEASARVHGYPTFTLHEHAVLTVRHGLRRTPLARCHQSRRPIPAIEVPEYPGLRISPPAACIVELATVTHIGRVRLALDEALAARTVRLDRVVEHWFDARSRRLPVRDLGRLLAERAATDEPPTSELNRLLHELLRRVLGPPAATEAPFPGVERPGSVVDAVLQPERIVVEADGRRWHSRVRDFARDRERDRAAARAGYVTARFTYEEIRGSADSVVQELDELRAQRRRDLGFPPLLGAA